MNNEFLSTDEHEDLAKRIVRHLVDELRNPDTVKAIVDVWGAHMDERLGRGVRRMIYTAAVAFAAVISVKLGLLDWISGAQAHK